MYLSRLGRRRVRFVSRKTLRPKVLVAAEHARDFPIVEHLHSLRAPLGVLVAIQRGDGGLGRPGCWEMGGEFSIFMCQKKKKKKKLYLQICVHAPLSWVPPSAPTLAAAAICWTNGASALSARSGARNCDARGPRKALPACDSRTAHKTVGGGLRVGNTLQYNDARGGNVHQKIKLLTKKRKKNRCTSMDCGEFFRRIPVAGLVAGPADGPARSELVHELQSDPPHADNQHPPPPVGIAGLCSRGREHLAQVLGRRVVADRVNET
jgi:hypothetical protein